MHVITGVGLSSAYTRNPQQRIRPDQQRQIVAISCGKPKIPGADERSHYKVVASILATLDAKEVFRKDRASKGQARVLRLFKETCEREKLPLELNKPQLRAYLCELYNLNYTTSTITHRWHPIYDIILHRNIALSDDLMNLYSFVCEQARPRVDKKLPVSHILLNQQLTALDAFLAPGYKNILAKATLATAWAAQLRVSEYTSKLVADMRSGEDHNLKSHHILIQDDGLTVIFSSDKTSKQRKERFIQWDKIPIAGFKKLMQEYHKLRMKKSPVYFCHADGTNLTPNDISNWIELATLCSEWNGLKITSHCYRIGGTSYLYRSGLDIPNLQRSGRWSSTDTTSVEHYLKPGLYSISPQTIKDTLPQYKHKMSLARAIYLRDCITTPGGINHPFNTVLKDNGFPHLQRSNYPTNHTQCTIKGKQTVALAAKFMQKMRAKKVIQTKETNRRAAHALQLKTEINKWRKLNNPTYGKFTDIRRYTQCLSCCSTQCYSRSAEAKIQALASEIMHQKELAKAYRKQSLNCDWQKMTTRN